MATWTGSLVAPLILLAAAGCVTAPPQQPPPAATPALEAAMQEAYGLAAPGAAMAVVDSRRADFETMGNEWTSGDPVGADTVFQIASLTKPFTAIVILRLAEQGRLGLDDPAARWLDWLPPRYGRVTLRQLLTHTSGVPRDLRQANVDEFSLEEFRRRLAAAEPSFAPGERWEYANTGYILLSMVAERAGGESFGSLLEDLVFRPLGMSRTHYRAPLVAARGRAVGFDWQESGWQPASPVYSGYGNSGIESTARDLARFAAALQQRRLLRSESYEAMLAPARLASGAPVSFPFRDASQTSYGFGWFLSEQCGTRVAIHGGTIAGFSSNLSWALDRGVSVAVLSNGKSGADRIGLADKIAAAALREALGC